MLVATTAPLSVSAAEGVPRLGRPLSATQASVAGVTIFADGRGLPAGSGDARLGRAVFAQHCARCHGDGGRGGSAPELVGGTAPLASARPDRTIGLLWPFAAPLFDFNWRAMPMDKPGILSVDEAYAVTAFLLSAEGIIAESAVMNRQTLPKVQMPNRAGFDWIDVRPQAGR
ncbi:MAG: c-type cytochrome [Herminiimonas sp.]|nr:c-type cytochrome [Herminiimonas sp.]